jgi:hypothetical protein
MAKIVFFPERRNKNAKIMKVCGKNMPKYSCFIWKFARLFVSLQRQNISFDYAAECGEQGLIDTAPF